MNAREDAIAEFLRRREEGEELTPAQFAAERDGGDLERDELERLLHAALALEDELAGSSIGPPMEPERRIGPYIVHESLGAGASGQVWRAQDSRDGAAADLVALKVLHPAVALDARARERFRRECEALAQRRDSHVVRVLDVGEDQGIPYAALEYVEGIRLSEWVPAAPLVEEPAIRRAVEVVVTLARALEEVHAAGILHRDVKPSNVVLRDNGDPVLLDFGLVGLPDAATFTGTGDVVGTPQFMAPEQARGEAVDARADVFALGALLHCLLSGAPPHAADSALASLTRARQRSVPSLRRCVPAAHGALVRIVHRATAFDRNRRTPSSGALADDLERFLRGEPVRSRGPNLVEHAARLRRERPALCAAVAVALIAAAFSVAFWQRGTAIEAGPPSPAAVRAEAERVRRILGTVVTAGLDRDPDRARAQLADLAPGGADRSLHEWWLDGTAEDRTPEGALAAGIVAREQGRLEEAAALLEEAVRTNGGSALAHVYLIRVATARQDWSGVLRECNQLGRLLPKCAWVQKQRGRAAHHTNDHRLAVASLSYAARIFDDVGAMWLDLAVSAHEVGDVELALSSAQSAVRCARDQEADSLIERVLLLEGILLDRHGQHADAEGVFREILERRPKKSSAHFRLAMNLDWQHRFEDAESQYLEALELNPDSARIDAALAWLYSGSDHACEDCQSFFASENSLRDDERAREYALTTLEKDAGRDRKVIYPALQVLKRIDVAGAVEDGAILLGELLDRTEDDERIATLVWAQRQLR